MQTYRTRWDAIEEAKKHQVDTNEALIVRIGRRYDWMPLSYTLGDMMDIHRTGIANVSIVGAVEADGSYNSFTGK